MFMIIAATLIVLAFIWIVPSLLKQHDLSGLDRKEQNINIARERLDEIAADHATGVIDDETFESTKTELEASLIDDVAQQTDDTLIGVDSKKYGLLALIVLVFFIPLSTYYLYQKLGSPNALEFVGANAGKQQSLDELQGNASSMADLIIKLKTRLEKNPKDGDGWFLLSKVHMAQKQYQEAIDALNKTRAIHGEHPTVLLGLADASAMLKEGDLTGEPSVYIEKALELDPENVTGLWLGGMSAQQEGKFQLAVDRWTKVLPKVAAEPSSQEDIKTLIFEAVRQAKEAGIELTLGNQLEEVTEKKVKVTITLDDAIASNLKPTDVVFIFAKAALGPPMPLAAYKTTVGELPFSITLDDSLAMLPQMKLSLFDEVIVSARVALEGEPIAQVGDYSSDQVKLSLQPDAAINLSIKHKVTDPASIPIVEHIMQSSIVDEDTMATDSDAPAIKIWVSLTDEMASKALPDDVVFVFAKATSGPPMPLAAFKTTVSELPMEVTLDDSMAMMPQMKLSSFNEVSVSARVAKSGAPKSMPGDLSSSVQTIKVDGIVGLELSISELIQ